MTDTPFDLERAVALLEGMALELVHATADVALIREIIRRLRAGARDTARLEKLYCLVMEHPHGTVVLSTATCRYSEQIIDGARRFVDERVEPWIVERDARIAAESAEGA